jgi:hypothetical protein
LTMPDGSRVGFRNLDNILKEVADLKLTEAQTIRTELLKRVKTCNYVVSGADNEYSVALIQEYQRKYGEPGAMNIGGNNEAHKHSRR